MSKKHNYLTYEFLHIKNKPNNFYAWIISNAKNVNIPDFIFKDYIPTINLEITKKESCILESFQIHDNIDHEINLECYHIEWLENNDDNNVIKYIRFMYIPKKEIDNIIRKIKIEKLK